MAESYICILDMSTGFRFESQGRSWRNAQFKADSKYIVSRSSHPSNTGKWEVKETGQTIPVSLNTLLAIARAVRNNVGGVMRICLVRAMSYWLASAREADKSLSEIWQQLGC